MTNVNRVDVLSSYTVYHTVRVESAFFDILLHFSRIINAMDMCYISKRSATF